MSSARVELLKQDEDGRMIRWRVEPAPEGAARITARISPAYAPITFACPSCAGETWATNAARNTGACTTAGCACQIAVRGSTIEVL